MCNQQHPSSLTDSTGEGEMLCTGYPATPEDVVHRANGATSGPDCMAYGEEGKPHVAPLGTDFPPAQLTFDESKVTCSNCKSV